MKISLNWIKDYVDLTDVDYDDLISKFGLRTAEVEGVEHKGKDIENVIVARIVEVRNHPGSDHLHLLKVDTGRTILDVVCGAPNVRVNMKVALAMVGGNVCGTKIEKATILGEDSYGMCCSKEELGFSENEEGIWEVDESLPLGTDIKRVYQLEDTIFEIDNKSLTNRPDLWSHYGIAREIAAILDRPLKPIVTENLQYYATNGQIDITVDTENCYRYCGIKIGNITKKVSPIGVQIRLFYCGMRAINLLADITNYVMLDIGQPMHAFDGDLVKNIQVVDAKEDTEFLTLDKQTRIVPKGSTLICSNHKPVCVAGVMGGLESEITDNTKNLLLESACFDAASIRKTAIKLGLRTEASARYEKSLDPELTTVALARFVRILREIDSQITIQSALTDVYNRKYKEITIQTTMNYINKYVGIEFKPEQVSKILSNLGFKVDFSADTLYVKVPTFRATKDVSIPADIVEEVARMYGYDNIPQIPVDGDLEPVKQSREHLMEYDTKLLLAEKFNLNEVHTYIWSDKKTNNDLNIETESFVKVLMSTVKENDEIRSELIPSMLKVINDNKKYEKELGVFEIGRVVTGLDANNLAVEEKHLAVALASEYKTEKDLYFQLKEMFENIVDNEIKAEVRYEIGKAKSKIVHPKNNAICLVNNQEVGYIALVHPKVANKLGKNYTLAVMEIDFKKLASFEKENVKVEELTKYQSSSLDLNFVVSKNEVFQDVIELLKSYKTDLDYSVSLVDVYEDNLLLPNKKSLTFNFQISSKTHTLTGEELDKFQKDMIYLAEQNGYMLRR